MKTGNLKSIEKIDYPVWDYDLEKKIMQPGEKYTFLKPVPVSSIQYKSFNVTFSERIQEISIYGNEEITNFELAQIADIFRIKNFKINRSRNNFIYLSYGPKSFFYLKDEVFHKSETCQLKYEKCLCTGYTIIINEPINIVVNHISFESNLYLN